MSERRRSGQRPSGESGPSRSSRPSSTRAGRRPTKLSDAAIKAAAEVAERPRLTGQAVVLILVLGVLAVSYASSMRAYLDQRSEIGELKGIIAERREAIDELEREKTRWEDPEFVRQQARERFGYVMPGEIAFVVLDEDGEPLKAQSELSSDPVVTEVPSTAWETTWESIKIAGNPPRPDPIPSRRISGD